MAAKQSHTFAVVGSKEAVIAKLTELQALAPHKWLPIEEMATDRTATCTLRQADWMSAQVAKKVAGSTLTLTFAAKPVEPQPA
jgi:hypothetical protein